MHIEVMLPFVPVARDVAWRNVKTLRGNKHAIYFGRSNNDAPETSKAHCCCLADVQYDGLLGFAKIASQLPIQSIDCKGQYHKRFSPLLSNCVFA